MNSKEKLYSVIEEFNKLLERKSIPERELSGMFYTVMRRLIPNGVRDLKPIHINIKVEDGKVGYLSFKNNIYFSWGELPNAFRGICVNTNGAYDKTTLNVNEIINSVKNY